MSKMKALSPINRAKLFNLLAKEVYEFVAEDEKYNLPWEKISQFSPTKNEYLHLAEHLLFITMQSLENQE